MFHYKKSKCNRTHYQNEGSKPCDHLNRCRKKRKRHLTPFNDKNTQKATTTKMARRKLPQHSDQFSSVTQSCPTLATPWTAACQASLSNTNSQLLLKLMSIELVLPSNNLILCHPHSSFLQSFLASGPFLVSQFFISGSKNIRVSASVSVLPMNIQDWFRLVWLDLFAVQGTLKSLLQHHSSKALILPRSASFIVQLSHPCVTTGKAITLTRMTFVGKVMSLLFKYAV